MVLSYSLDGRHLPLGIFFNFMFSYLNIIIEVGAVYIPELPCFLENMAVLGYILYPHQGCHLKHQNHQKAINIS
jgi:hypothetical protein